MTNDMQKTIADLLNRVECLETRQQKHLSDLAGLWKKSKDAETRLATFKPSEVEKAMVKMDAKVKAATECIAIRTHQQMVLTEVISTMRRQHNSIEDICHALRALSNAMDEKTDKWWRNTLDWTVGCWVIWILRQPRSSTESTNESMISTLQ